MAYEEDVDVSEEKIRSWISSGEKLGVLAPRALSENKRNYSVVKALEERGFSRDEGHNPALQRTATTAAEFCVSVNIE